jgi:hypothetical protein
MGSLMLIPKGSVPVYSQDISGVSFGVSEREFMAHHCYNQGDNIPKETLVKLLGALLDGFDTFDGMMVSLETNSSFDVSGSPGWNRAANRISNPDDSWGDWILEIDSYLAGEFILNGISFPKPNAALKSFLTVLRNQYIVFGHAYSRTFNLSFGVNDLAVLSDIVLDSDSGEPNQPMLYGLGHMFADFDASQILPLSQLLGYLEGASFFPTRKNWQDFSRTFLLAELDGTQVSVQYTKEVTMIIEKYLEGRYTPRGDSSVLAPPAESGQQFFEVLCNVCYESMPWIKRSDNGGNQSLRSFGIAPF